MSLKNSEEEDGEVADAVIIGSGAIGLSTAYYLSKLGYRDIVILEQNSVLGGFNTQRCAGGFRYQFSRKINIEMSKLSMKLIQELGKQRREEYNIKECGYLFLLSETEDVHAYKNTIDLQNNLGIPTKWIPGNIIREKFKMFNIDDVIGGAFCNKDFLMNPTDLTNAYISELRKVGVKMYVNSKVVGIETKENKICGVKVKNEIINTPVLINATGPWSSQISELLGIKLPIKPLKQQLFTTNKVEFVNDDFPVIIFIKDNLGIHKEGDGILTGLTMEGESSCEDIRQKEVDFDWEVKHCKALCSRMPSMADRYITSSWTGFYDMTPDELPIICQIPGIKGFYCNAGFSGHGFMHSPAAGLLMAETIVNGEIGSICGKEFDLKRFGEMCDRKVNEYYKI
ncbi:MAG: FAD-binding oxidoreductase [Lachnospiraceae bacterium]|nr:FAD-binding oxidoreductase [Lachnospiraceae bacterium]